METKHQTREAWLQAAVAELTPLFDEVEDATVPPLRISIGWPGGRANKKTTRGQCWSKAAAEDEHNHLFISPWVKEPIIMLSIVLHEMIHAVDDCASGHKGNFIRLAKAVGLKAKWTTATPTDDLWKTLAAIEERLGAWPTGVMFRPGEGKAADTPAKQGTRMLKVVCPTDGVDGYKVRMTQSWIDKVGCPICPCHGETMELGA